MRPSESCAVARPTIDALRPPSSFCRSSLLSSSHVTAPPPFWFAISLAFTIELIQMLYSGSSASPFVIISPTTPSFTFACTNLSFADTRGRTLPACTSRSRCRAWGVTS